MLDEKKLLRFLQAHKFDIARSIPGYVDSFLSDDSTKVVLRVAVPLLTTPTFTFDGEEVPVEILIDNPEAKPVDGTVVMAGPMKPMVVGAEPTSSVFPTETAIGAQENGGRDKAAFEAWQKRHSHVKVK